MAGTRNGEWDRRSKASKAANQKRNAARQRERIKLAQDYKRQRGCIACGWGVNADEYDVCALQFDHLEGHNKVADVSDMYKCSAQRFWAEIQKCQVICARCHAVREARRRIHYPGMSWQEAKANEATQLTLDND